ncbi:uncharacterized mitochondrial protein AtMg00810-like [Aristolochia californica]|uniref:uncharacterized mitochondrial protein AtMg00810-like n=1 Tax=Aristolochia californica TaxID=171875 RepID=UPI0035DE1ABF
MVVSHHLSVGGPLFLDRTLYRSLVGALQYLTITRPDIAHAVNSINQFLYAPTEEYFLIVKRILRYADYLDTHRSTSSYSVYLGDNLISWSAKKQPTVSRSDSESIYRALAYIVVKLLWLTHLLCDLHVPIPQRSLLLCDKKCNLF